MVTRQRHIGKEIGTALAVLAIYVLTLLTPLHQARASQLEFSRLGYATLDAGWVLCGAELPGGDAGRQIISKCPVSGVGKTSLDHPIAAGALIRHKFVAAPAEAATVVWRVTPSVLDLAAPPQGPPIA